MDDLGGAMDDARRLRDAWTHWLADGAAPAYEAYVAAAGPLAARLAPLVKALAESAMLAVSAEDGTGRFVRLAVEAADEEDARLVLYAAVVTERSEVLPALDDLSGDGGPLALRLSPGTGAALERLAALEAALRGGGRPAEADEAAAIAALLADEGEIEDG